MKDSYTVGSKIVYNKKGALGLLLFSSCMSETTRTTVSTIGCNNFWAYFLNMLHVPMWYYDHLYNPVILFQNHVLLASVN